MRRTPLATAIGSVFAVSAIAAPQMVMGQTEEDGADQEVLDEVITTGSRIKKDAFTTTSPMDIIDVDVASVQGIANVGQLLQTSTIAAGSPQVTAATSAQFVQNGGLGASTISLRGLGANRTLVLVNGRRAGPAGIKGAVSSFDLNVLPLTTIERVEVLKDGASSIYGSDAVAGVVNIITRKEDGGSIDGFVSTPTTSGGEETRLSASWGKTFDRGNFRVTADYNERKELRRGSRDYFTCGNQYIFDQATGDRADIIDPRTGQRWCEDLTWGHVWLYDYADPSNVPNPSGGSLLSQYDYDNDLGQHIPGYAVDPNNPSWLTQPGGFFPVAYDATSDAVTNDNHPFQDKESLNPELELTTFYGEGEFHITDSMTAYTEVLLNRRKTASDSYRQYWSYIYSGDHTFWPDPNDPNCADPNDPLFDECEYTLQPLGGNSLSADAGWFGQQWYSPTAITDHNDSHNQVDYQRLVLGIRGEFGDNWDWDLSYMYSNSDASYTEDVIYDDAIRDQNWLTGPCAGTPTSVRGEACVDVPWLDPELLRGNVSPAVASFLFGQETGNTEYTQWAVDGYVTGDAWDLPAGPLATAIGFHYRSDEINDTPGETTLAGNSWFGDFAGITAGDDTTVAVFAEFDIPLIVDRPGFENLTLNASARYTDVDSYGDDTTWKVGLNWQVVDSFRLRANAATSFRTPALFELYLADQTSSISQRSDPCIRYEAEFQAGNISNTVYQNCLADPAGLDGAYTGGTITPTVFTGGGLGVLEAETSDSFTAGFIWQPEFADVSVSIDYFEFEVLDQVDQLGGARIVLNCYESEFGFAFGNTEPLCNLFDRSGVNQGIDNVRDSFINVARQTNKGYDVAVRYETDIGPGSITLDAKATRQTEDTQALFEETAEDFNGRVGDPKWVGETKLTYYWDDFTFFWGMNWIGDSSSVDALGGSTVQYRSVIYDAVRYTDDVFYHSFSASYAMDNGLTVLLGIANAFDENPPQLTRIQSGNEYDMIGNSMLKSNYDMLGQRVFLNATWDFE